MADDVSTHAVSPALTLGSSAAKADAPPTINVRNENPKITTSTPNRSKGIPESSIELTVERDANRNGAHTRALGERLSALLVTEAEAADKNPDTEEISNGFRYGNSQFETARRTDLRANTAT